ncbi:autophagy-related protein 2 homolog B [Stomoxys calcitrans]|uniref:autophagy-related protein 2 homolog B n=1 Tax=Stomoxys calcitrans TaxID=35570 RepID=UPI0027E2764C|nr:autophagy-related protein 2 homolog B [Stomoxys calcitrans]
MSWFNVWDGLKNKTCRYLLQRYLGQFLDENLNLEQLNIELYNGKATIKNVSLRVETLNELFEAQGWPLEFTDGQIGQLTLSVPWNALMTSDSAIEVADVVLCIRPVRREHDGTSMIESMWSSVSSSLQLAEEYMRQEENESDTNTTQTTIGGLEKFAETIDNVLNRIRAKFSNITIQIEHPLVSSLKGIAFKIHLDEVLYKNETGNEKSATTQKPYSEDGEYTADVLNRIPTYTKHNIRVTGAHIYTQELKSDVGSAQPSRQQDIPVLQLNGEQHVQIKVKQSEDVTGPKIYFYIELGGIGGICSPQQIQMLLEFLEAFTDDSRYKKSMQSSHSNDMLNNMPESAERFESFGGGSGILGNQSAWISADDGATTNLQPNTNYARTTTNYASHQERYCDSISSSMSSRSTLTSVSRYQRKPTNLDSSGEITDFVCKVASFVWVVLQEDILVESASNYYESLYNEQSLNEQTRVSQSFFDQLQAIPMDSDELHEVVLCNKNHILLRLHPLVAEGKQNRNKNILQFNASVNATQLDFCEVLEGRVTPLLTFKQRKGASSHEYHFKPELGMQVASTNYVNLKNKSTTNVSLELAPCALEFDVSIIDRLGALFAPSPYASKTHTVSAKEAECSGGALNTTINVSCANLDVNIRFPIIDAKPAHDPERVPWWKQNIRTDYLLLSLEQMNVKYCNNRVQLSSREINIYYCEDRSKKIHIVNTRFKRTDQPHGKEPLFEYPQLFVDINDEACCESPCLPFSSKRNCRQSSTAQPKVEMDVTETILLPGEAHEINEFCQKSMASSVIGIRISFPILNLFLESKQLFELIYNRLNSDLFMWEPSSPYLTGTPTPSLQEKCFASMQNLGLMDSVYISAVQQQSTHPPDPFEGVYQTKSMSMGTRHHGDDDGEEDDDDNKAAADQDDETDDEDDFTYRSSILHNEPKSKRQEDSKKLCHRCSVEINIGHATAAVFVPVRDADNHILPEVLGKFLLYVDDLRIFSLNGYCDDPCLAYFCLQVNSVEMYHGGVVPMNSPLRCDNKNDIEDYMKSTFYKIPPGLTKGIIPCGKGDNSEMVTVAIEIRKNLAQHIKRLKITAGIKNTTLRYIPMPPSYFWLNQLLDFLDVMDFPIEGYEPFSVISEMQLHLWDCAIDFRPDNFPYRAVLELFYFSVSSNIISSMPGCNLRFVLEECVFSVAPHDTAKLLPCNKVTHIDAGNMVPVLDFGLLEISLRISGTSTEKHPKLDLRCSLQDVHLRTCYDSGSAFALLIGYIANNIAKDDDAAEKGSLNSSLSSDSDLFMNESQTSSDISQRHQERVNLLMAEAVRDGEEVMEASDAELTPRDDELKLFYFPDESCGSHKDVAREMNLTMASHQELEMPSTSTAVASEPLALIKGEFGIINEQKSPRKELKSQASSEEDYCFIVGEERVEHDFEDIKISEDPLRIVDNHFCLPSSHNDILKAPATFPLPEMRYTLCEMTVTWHLYGGNDFALTTGAVATAASSSATSREPAADANAAMSDAYRHGVSNASNQCRPQQDKKPKEKLTWKSKGGKERNHEILVEIQLSKVGFSYEVYPLQAAYASRQVFLVNELEIRDRLQTSEINKFLYNANTKQFGNKRMKHMVVVKSLHVRPNPEQSTAQECSLKISLSPLRLHIDQDTLEFMTDFFTSFGKSCESEQAGKGEGSSDKPKAPAPPPTATICNDLDIPEAVQDLRARRIVNENLSILIDDQAADSASVSSRNRVSPGGASNSDSPTYFREVVFSPDISICFDYHGRRVELSKGPVAGLLMGLGQLQCSEIILKKIVYRRGILGLEKVFTYLAKEWLKDIKRNQLPKILSGVGPTYAFVQLFQGIYDLFWLPIEHYQKDGRIIRGLQLGAQSFSARTILAALEITSRFIQLLQFTAETAFDMVSPGPSVRQLKRNRRGQKRRTHRPKDIREGVVNAYQIVKDGINDSANNLIETAVAEHDQKGLTGAVGAVMRQVPQLVVCPAVLATQATTNILGGVKSSLVPDSKIEAKKKWKDENC